MANQMSWKAAPGQLMISVWNELPASKPRYNGRSPHYTWK